MTGDFLFAILLPHAARHFVSQGLGIAALTLALCTLAGTLYALGFALVGIFTGSGSSAENAHPNAVRDNANATNFLVLVPAHNESSGLIATVAGVLNQQYPHQRIRCVVIADNCTDDTAEVAAAAGAQVLIRTDPTRRGKGHALAWAFALVGGLSWDAACILDADSVIAPDFFAALDRSIQNGHEVVQSRYDFEATANRKNWLQQFTAVSKAGENSFVYRSRNRMGLFQLLMGNGFCVSRAVLDRVPWRAHSIVEDAEYAIELGKKGIAIHYQERARVWSRQASTIRDVQPQRVRWASGTGQLFRQAVPALFLTAWRRRSAHALEGILMLLMTSRLLLVYLLGLSLLLNLGAFAPLSTLTWSLLAGVVLLQSLYLLLMFRFASDRPEPWAGLLRLPYYIAVIASAQALALAGFNRRVWWRTAR